LTAASCSTPSPDAGSGGTFIAETSSPWEVARLASRSSALSALATPAWLSSWKAMLGEGVDDALTRLGVRVDHHRFVRRFRRGCKALGNRAPGLGVPG
jgi:hypothetical protein